jgi:TPR repeat protein
MGHPAGQLAVGDAHAHCGDSCLPKNEEEAAKWYEASAKQGNEEALSMIVEYYQLGIGVKQDHAEAARLLRNAAARGDETAKWNLRAHAKRYGPPYGIGNDEMQ